MKTTQEIHCEEKIPEECTGKRLDLSLAALFPQYSRMRLKSWIESGQILVDGMSKKPKDKVIGGEHISINVTIESEIDNTAENIPLDIIFEDDDLIIVNKPVGMVVHPAAGNHSNTLLNALLFHSPQLANLVRAGIIHRIDKDTSGLLVIAKTLEAQTNLTKQLQNRTISREYEAIVQGVLTGGGTISEPIGRHPHQRLKMAVVEHGREATTHYWVIKRFNTFTHIKVKLETGRTHQIRVHMANHHHPIVGDQTYGGRMKLPKDGADEFITALKAFKRQALHAKRLEFIHPRTGKTVSFEAELPKDMKRLLELMEAS